MNVSTQTILEMYKPVAAGTHYIDIHLWSLVYLYQQLLQCPAFFTGRQCFLYRFDKTSRTNGQGDNA